MNLLLLSIIFKRKNLSEKAIRRVRSNRRNFPITASLFKFFVDKYHHGRLLSLGKVSLKFVGVIQKAQRWPVRGFSACIVARGT